MPNDLRIQSTTVTVFLNDKLTPEQIRELQKLWTLIQSCIEKFSCFEVNLGPGPKLVPPKLALQNWSSKIGSPKLDLQKLRYTINEFSKNKRSIQKRCTCCWISQNQEQIQENFRSERLGEQSMNEDFEKIFKPITEQQQKSSEEIVSRFAPFQEAIENMPPALP